MVNSAVSNVPLSASSVPGALTLVTLNTMADVANLLNAATMKSSMPCKFPWLSNIGHVSKIRKLANGDIAIWLLLLGVMYGSPGITMQLLAKMVAGGYGNTDQTPLLVKAVAMVLRSVVIAAVVIYPHILFGDIYGAKRPRILPIMLLPMRYGDGLNPSKPTPPV